MVVPLVTRSVGGDEQFSGTNRARINRHAGHPGQGVESCPRPSTQSVSHLCNRPPHKFLKGFVLIQYRTARCVFNVLRAPPFERSAIGPSPRSPNPSALVPPTDPTRYAPTPHPLFPPPFHL